MSYSDVGKLIPHPAFSKEAYDALPRGSSYIGIDGTVATKGNQSWITVLTQPMCGPTSPVRSLIPDETK